MTAETVLQPLPEKVLARIARSGVVLPRQPRPGEAWKPRTAAEDLLLNQARSLDRMRGLLLIEVHRLRAEALRLERENQDLLQERHPVAKELRQDLEPEWIALLAGAAVGENLHVIGRRLGVSQTTCIRHRGRLLAHLGVRTMTQAVAIAVGHGLIARPPLGDHDGADDHADGGGV